MNSEDEKLEREIEELEALICEDMSAEFQSLRP